jgi:secondary thiamine-phosphate synthase enzyme
LVPSYLRLTHRAGKRRPERAPGYCAILRSLAPEQTGRYAHEDEGPDDMPAHLRTMLTATQLSIPVMEGEMTLGTWQGIYLFEHRRAPQRREIVVHLIGE